MIKRLSLVVIALLALNIHAQEGTTSPYSFYGIGSLKFKGTTENRSMGGLSVYTDSIHMNLRNPASFGGKSIKSFNGEGSIVKFTVGGSGSNTSFKSNSTSASSGTATFDYLALSFPIGKLGVGFGLMPYTSVGYKLESLNASDKPEYRYRGEGGVNKAFLGLGYEIIDNLSIGVNASYNFGNTQNSVIDFGYDDDGNFLQYQTRESNRSDLSGLDYNFGLTYSPMINEKLQLSSSITFSPKANLTSTNSRVIEPINVNLVTGDDFAINNGSKVDVDLAALGLDKTDLIIPTKTSFGLGIGQPRKWFFGSEYTFLKTSEFSNDIFGINNLAYKDASTIALGGFFVPQYNSFKYWKRAVYRAGARFENTGLEINGQSINEFGISFGVGLPISGRSFSNANFGFEIGERGTVSQNLVKEKFINFQISLSLNDRWFMKRKYN